MHRRERGGFVIYRGDAVTADMLSAVADISAATIQRRLDAGWTPEAAAETPVGYKGAVMRLCKGCRETVNIQIGHTVCGKCRMRKAQKRPKPRELREIVCTDCGETVTTAANNKTRCDECQHVYKLTTDAERRRKDMYAKRRAMGSPEDQIAEINRRAADAGMTYGQYVARMGTEGLCTDGTRPPRGRKKSRK